MGNLDLIGNLSKVDENNKIFNSKRLFDIFFSSIVLIFFLPLIFFVSILIKLTSKGDVFYVQERITIDQKKFKIYKFRTMKNNAENKTGPIFADENDSRCTKIGHFLRKTSFDEIPQFFNVLIGDMSIVGPRPERPYYVSIFEKEIPNYNRRHSVKSGITGLAQINGLRGKTSIEMRIFYDLKYIDNMSFFFDLKIIFKTVYLVLFDFFKLIKASI